MNDQLKTLLVTGGAGFIGSALIRKAIAKGYRVVNIDCLTYAANLENLRSVKDSSNYQFEQVSINDRPALKEVVLQHKPDGIIHLAAESHVDRSIDAPQIFLETNVIGTANLLELSRDYLETYRGPNAFRFLHVSTDEVYGDLTLNEPAFTELHPYKPSSPYSASKAASDHLVRSWGRTYGLPVLISNCSNNYGPFQFPEKLIPVTILRALQKKPLPVYGTGENIRDWLYVDDHADALLTIIERGRPGETYNVGGDSEKTNIDLVKMICQILSEEVPQDWQYEDLITFVDDRPGHDLRYAINAQKIKTELDWTPSVSIESGLRNTVKWYVDNHGWWERTSSAIDQRLGTRQ